MNKRFLEKVAEQILKHAHAGGKRAVVLPNRRAGVFLRYAISKQTLNPTLSPAILTIEDFFYQLSGLIKVEQVEQIFALHNAYKTVYKGDSEKTIDEFFSWAPTFLSDCNELDTNLVDTDDFFSALYLDRELRNWAPNQDLTQMQKEYLAFWETAKDMYNEFTRSLLEQNKAYGGLAYRFAIDNLENFHKNLPFEHILFVGFNALNKAEEKLFDFYLENNLGSAMWDIDAYYFKDFNHKAGQYFRARYSKWWPNEAWENPPKNIGANNQSFQIIETENNTAQCEVAGEILSQLSENAPLDNKTAIILSDEKLLQPLLFHLPQGVGKYNITMGKALTQFPMFHLFDGLFQLAAAQFSGNKGWAYPASSLKPLLFSAFLRRLSKENIGEALFNYITTKNAAIVWEEDVQDTLNNNAVWKAILEPKKDSFALLKSFNSLIEQLRISYFDEENKVPIQLLFEFKKLVNQLMNQQSGHDALSISSMRSLFRQVCSATKLPYEGEPLHGLQIMGVLETRALDFENLIILSTNEGILPKGRSGNSFIPHIFKQKYDIQTFKDRDAIYAYSFYRLLHHAKQVYLVHNGLEGNLGGGEASRFIMQLKAEYEAKTNRAIPIVEQVAAQEKVTQSDSPFQIEKSTAVLEGIRAFLTNRGLSASSINKLVKNPMDFYFQYIAKLNVPNALEVNIEANTFGSVVHDALEELYKNAVGQQLSVEYLNSLRQQAAGVIDLQFQKHYQKGVTDSGMNHLMRKAAAVLIEKAIDFDVERLKQHQIRIIGLEKEFTTSLTLTLHGEAVEVKLSGKIDRIQEVDGVIEIIDYKTGKVEAPKLGNTNKIHSDPSNDKLVQLLVYAALLQQNYALENLRPCLQGLRSWQKGLVFLNDSAHTILEQKKLEELKEQLTILLENLLNPDMPFTPETDDNKLKFSNYKEIYA